jgi:FlaA1/EpsC-like NDP-sugar epimerase
VALVAVRVLSRTALQKVQIEIDRDHRKSIVVIGAGCAAAMLLRELPRSGYLPVALVDDDPSKAGVRLHGIPVVGKVADLPEVVRQHHPTN